MELCAQIDAQLQIVLPNEKIRKFKLPALEFKKFNRETKEFLRLWSQFEKINIEENIAADDKMQYLL